LEPAGRETEVLELGSRSLAECLVINSFVGGLSHRSPADLGHFDRKTLLGLVGKRQPLEELIAELESQGN
jgi:hypothetical protein